MQLGSHWCPGSQRRSRAVEWHSREPLASPCHGEHLSRRAQSPSLSCSRQQVTFEDSLSIGANDFCPLSWEDEMALGDHSDWSQPEPEDLESPPMLDPWVQEFLTGEEMPWAGNKCEDDPNQPTMPKPSLEDSNN